MRSLGNIQAELSPRTSFGKHDAFLRANSEAYEWLVGKVQSMDRRKKPESVLIQIKEAARFAMEFHSGRFADGAVENVAFEIGMELDTLAAEERDIRIPVVRKESSRRILHVAYEVLSIGGLTRMLYHWIQNDPSSCHSVLLMNQGSIPIPEWFSGAVRNSGGNLISLPSEAGFCQKARWLRNASRRSADLVVLHHCGFDMVPTIAFAVPDCPPVAVLNHADHLFWLGSSVSDMVINLRTAGSIHSAERRSISCNTVLPIPLADPAGVISRHEARRALGIPDDQILLLSVGRAEKYRPCGSYDFVATAWKILDRQPGAHLYVVGESPEGIEPYLCCELHERLHFIGEMENPSLYRAGADIYLESFPFGSQTALLEAALSGLPVVPAYAPLFPLLVANDDSIQNLIPNPHDEKNYIERVELLVHQNDARVDLGERLRKCLLVDHVGKGWLDRLAAMYQETDRLTHGPRPIPISSCSLEHADIGLSLWHVMGNGRTSTTMVPADNLKGVLCHTAYVAKDVGDYSTARRYACRALWQDPVAWGSWRLLVVSLIGRPGRLFRRILSQVRVIVKKQSRAASIKTYGTLRSRQSTSRCL